MSRTHPLTVCGLLLAGATACVDRPATVATDPRAPTESATVVATPQSLRRPDRLARLFARALANPGFRTYVKAQLDSSPFPEHKIQLQTFLGARGRRALRDLAEQNGTTEADVQQEAGAAIPLEVYFPVAAHRAAWSGDEHVLVATALADREAPVAFSPDGRRMMLSPDAPPATPVLAVVPVETDFTTPARLQCLECPSDGGGGTGTGAGPIGLVMTKAHFDGDYEGWLKGNPEYEIHILGQAGTKDSLTDYQCAGEHAGGPYVFDQNTNDWTGSVLLFSQTQLDGYKASHPGQSVRVLALEDDDTACKIITNKDDLNRIFKIVDSVYTKRTGGRDTTITGNKYYKSAKMLRDLFALLASFIKTNDDLIGTAIEDQVVGAFYPGFNWIVKGANNVTHGWLDLEMR
jgi:hypothetical protein